MDRTGRAAADSAVVMQVSYWGVEGAAAVAEAGVVPAAGVGVDGAAEGGGAGADFASGTGAAAGVAWAASVGLCSGMGRVTVAMFAGSSRSLR